MPRGPHRDSRINGGAEKEVLCCEVDQSVSQQLPELSFDGRKSQILFDIEGAELEVLTVEVLRFLRGATLIIALHGRLLEQLGLHLQERIADVIYLKGPANSGSTS